MFADMLESLRRPNIQPKLWMKDCELILGTKENLDQCIDECINSVAYGLDLETTGLDPRTDEIIEIGVLIVSFTNEDGFTKIDFTNNQLQQPNEPISEEITRITGITNEDVKDKAIDWNLLKDQLIKVRIYIN